MNRSILFWDILFVITAVLFNLLIMGIYIAQAHKREKLVRHLGTAMIFLIFPLDLVFASYLVNGRSLDILIAFGVVFAYLLTELLLDFILKFDFRSKTVWHIAYILLFYAAAFSLVGIAFAINEFAGYFVTVTFWAMLGALIYLYKDKIFRRKKSTLKKV